MSDGTGISSPSAREPRAVFEAASQLTARHEFAISSADSAAFAALSGDFNPLHLDPRAARRLVFGSAVPHGIHVLLSSLEGALADSGHPIHVRSLRAIFSAPA